MNVCFCNPADPQGLNTTPPDPTPTIPEPIMQSFAETADKVSGADNGTFQTSLNINSCDSTSAERLMSLLPLTVNATPEVGFQDWANHEIYVYGMPCSYSKLMTAGTQSAMHTGLRPWF